MYIVKVGNPDLSHKMTVSTFISYLITAQRIYPIVKDILIQGDNVTLTENDANLRITINSTGGGGDPVEPLEPPTTYTYYLGISEDDVFDVAEFTVSGNSVPLVVPTIPDGERRFVAYAKPASLGNFTYIYIYPSGNRATFNQIMGWNQLADTVMLGGVECYVLISSVSQGDVLSGFIVEAG